MSSRLQILLSARHEHRILGLMLIVLHSALWWDFGGPLSRSLMLVQLGLFLMWQPLLRRDQRLAGRTGILFILAAVAFAVWLNWWLMTFWLLLLTGLVGGRVVVGRIDRYVYLSTLLFLVSELLIGCIPPMFNVDSLGANVHLVFGYALPVIPVTLLALPAQEAAGEQRTRAVDLLYGLTMPLVATVLALGSLLSMYTTGANYATALFQSVTGLAIFLFVISWLWMPRAGYTGLALLWERYLLNIGTPFEQWLSELAHVTQRRHTPEDFLESAISQLVALPWVAGAAWKTQDSEGRVGKQTPHHFDVDIGNAEVTLFGYRQIGTTLLLHGKLLVRLVGYFYRAKQREQELTKQAHLQAVHETGARVTHDIKNLLQSLYTMTSAIQATTEEKKDEAQMLLQRQIPHLTQRLQLALDKLQAPQAVSVAESPLTDWWDELVSRNGGDGIRFHATLDTDPMIPVEVFDSVTENLLENARMKRRGEPELRINVTLVAKGKETSLTVCDSGSGVDEDTAKSLFKGPVKSKSGLGIGLYQAARQAEQMGYKLSLQNKEAGQVCFQLTRTTTA